MPDVALGPAIVNISGVRSGDQNLMNVTVTSDGAPFNLTGYTVTASARRSPTATEVLAAVCAITNAAQGKLSVRWPGTAVASMLNGNGEWIGVWDLQLNPGSGDSLTVAGGTFRAVLDVTRA